MHAEPEARTNHKRNAAIALLLIVPIPSIGTWMGMWAAEGTWYGQAIFAASKIMLLLFPLVWLIIVDREKPHIPKPTGKGMGAACITGVGIVAAIAAGYYLLAKPLDWIDATTMSAKAKEIGLDSPWIYLAGAVYWCTINSILEEYVWRWFVFTRCESLLPRYTAVVASALFFTIHHVLALLVYFSPGVTALAAAGVFVGGATWSWLYLRYRNIYAAYISHVFADVIIFYIGYELIFQSA